MNQLKHYTLTGAIFVIILGTFAHFFYKWSDQNWLIGLFTPINESTWEHMKLLFFPMLLFSFYAYCKLKRIYPCIGSALLTGILVGTALIPFIFYAYTAIIGHHIFIFDIATFLVSVMVAFYTVYILTLSCRMQKYLRQLITLIGILFLCFILFSCCHF